MSLATCRAAVVALAVGGLLAGVSAAPGAAEATATAALEAPPTVDADAPAVDPTAPTVDADALAQSGGVTLADVPGDAAVPPTVTATGAVLWDPADDVVLYGKDEHAGRPMASTTKIMTVLLALEALEAGAVPAELTVSAEAARVGRIPGAATLGLVEGQTVALADVLAALLLRSGNDGAVAVAEHVAGGEAAFVERMNRRAGELGLTDTHFVNATGLTDDLAHHASPLDLARLGQHAMAHPDFSGWAGAPTLDIPPFGVLENRNELLGAYPGATGIKTGFTSLAGLTLVASATRGPRALYAVVLGSEDRVADATALLDYGYGSFARPTALLAGEPAGSYRWAAGETALVAAEDLARTVVAGQQAVWRFRPDPVVALPVVAGDVLGVADLVVGDEVVATTGLLATGAVTATAPPTAGSALADTLRAFGRAAVTDRPVQ